MLPGRTLRPAPLLWRGQLLTLRQPALLCKPEQLQQRCRLQTRQRVQVPELQVQLQGKGIPVWSQVLPVLLQDAQAQQLQGMQVSP